LAISADQTGDTGGTVRVFAQNIRDQGDALVGRGLPEFGRKGVSDLGGGDVQCLSQLQLKRERVGLGLQGLRDSLFAGGSRSGPGGNEKVQEEVAGTGRVFIVIEGAVENQRADPRNSESWPKHQVPKSCAWLRARASEVAMRGRAIRKRW